MNERFLTKLILLGFLIFLASFLFLERISAQAEANDTMIVEVNLLEFDEESEIPEVGIEVPDYVFLGNVTRSKLFSDEITLQINNTGNKNITITPQLRDSNEKIFKWLYFRTMKSSTLYPELNIPYKIGEYSVAIEKPASGNTKRSKNIYMRLNLTEFDENLEEEIIGYQKEIIFFAMAE